MTNYDKLIETLKEVFMLDKAELDFGIYRIMNQKRKDIEQFLEKDLVPQVKKILADSLSVDKQALQKELDEAIKSAQSLGADPNTLPKVQQLKARLGEAADMEGIENEVFSLLANFFRRYFDNGDFISMRRYKKDVYSIPYEGEEVKLHWANADQYYIKTSEYFKNYRFKLSNGKAVCFELVEASTEQNNNKAQGDKERRFAIFKEKPCETVGEEFKIYFTYEPADKKIKQGDLLVEAFDTVRTQIPSDFSDLLSLRATDKDRQRTLLQKHLLDYTARNTFDYFIHKDLGGFLNRELDFYIKNEVLFIDDLNTRDEQEFLKQLSKIKAIKKIGEKIIIFLAQLENFQKKLWLKKKIVVECNYCVTLDRIPKELYKEIATNEAQIQEWIKLFAIDEIKANELFPINKTGFSKPMAVEFLNQNQFLVLDTVFFSETFKWKLISSIEAFDEQCDGLLI
jgi:adenine-specific DNA-methyltransferase